MASLKDQNQNYVELPSQVQKATDELHEVQKSLLERMASLDTATGRRMSNLRDEVFEQFNKVHEDLDMKINDVERKSMSFAQRAASRQAGEEKAKSQVKEAL